MSTLLFTVYRFQTFESCLLNMLQTHRFFAAGRGKINLWLAAESCFVVKGEKAFRPHLSWGSFSSGQTVRRRCSRTCRGWCSGQGWPAESPPPVSRLARNIDALCSPWWVTGARPASEGDAAAWLRWEMTGRGAGRWAAWLSVRAGRCKGPVLSTQVWDNHKGPSWKKENRLTKIRMATDELQQLQQQIALNQSWSIQGSQTGNESRWNKSHQTLSHHTGVTLFILV